MKNCIMRLLPAILITATLLMLTGCNPEQVRTEHEVSMQQGETLQLTLGNIPEGKSPEDYTWYYGRLLSPSGIGCVTADEMGSSSVSAQLKYRGKLYFEYFSVVVETVVGEITMDKTSAAIRAGNVLYLCGEPDIEMPSGENIQWKSSDASVATVERNNMPSHNFDDSHSVVTAVGVGTATITAYYGDTEAQCQVTVFDPQNADETLEYMSAWAECSRTETDGTYCAELGDFKTTLSDDEVKNGAGKAPDGKYLVLWDSETCVDGTEYDSAYDYTALLPPEYLPRNLAEVEYIIRVVEGEPIYVCDYEGGVKGYLRSADFILEDAATGKVIELLDSVNGSALPDKIYVSEKYPPTEYYGDMADTSTLRGCLVRIIGKLWDDNHGSVVFTDGSKVRFMYGDKVTLPETVTSISLYTSAPVRELVVPTTLKEILTETYFFKTVSKVTAPEGSFAAEWFSEKTDAEMNIVQ